MENAFLKLSFLFDEKRLLEDVKQCLLYPFVSHYNTADYSGKWKSISLRSLNGKMDQIQAHASGPENYQNTPLLDSCNYFKEIIDGFKCKKESIRLLNLTAKSKILEHTDLNLGYEDGNFRIHVPIQTNPDVHFYINNLEVDMLVGQCWYGNFNFPHRVDNQGKTDRIHLVIDCIRNPWSDDLFAKAGYNFKLENAPPQYSKETKIKMIEALELMNTETSRKIIEQLKSDVQ